MYSARQIATLSCLCATVFPASASAQSEYERGRELSQQLMSGDVAALQQDLSPKFLQAIGGTPGLTEFAGKLKADAGSEQELIEEHAFREGGFTSYYRVSRFEKMPSVTTRFVWGEDGVVIGASIKPTPTAAPTPHLDYATRATLRLPMTGPEQGAWYIAWGGRDPAHNYHVAAAGQRFAYDFVLFRDGKHHAGDGSRNEDHFCFRQPVIAPAAGRVVVATDGEADNARPGVKTNRSAPGNHVIIDHGSGEHSVIAHLRNGSVSVKPGQSVAAGDVVGQCGNSGKSDLPHVHYHLQTGSAFMEGQGLPAFFNGYFLGGRYIARGEPKRGDLLTQ